jgi:hypothetical protein
MPGYHLLDHEPQIAALGDATGRPSDRIGFLDFLRELHGDEPAITKFWTATVVGLEEVLFAAGGDADALAWEIHRRLRAAATQLEKRLADVYVVFRGRLQRGDDLWSEYRGTRLPIGHIFGAPRPQTDADGRRVFFTNFNLTNGD